MEISLIIFFEKVSSDQETKESTILGLQEELKETKKKSEQLSAEISKNEQVIESITKQVKEAKEKLDSQNVQKEELQVRWFHF